MIMDERSEFCDKLSVAAAAGTALVGDVMDLGANVKNIGRGTQLYLVVTVTTTFTSGGAATVNIQLCSDSTADLNTSPTVHWETGAVGFATLTARTVSAHAKRFIVALPQGLPYERYLGIKVVTAAAITTAGSISAFLTPHPDNWDVYPEGNN